MKTLAIIGGGAAGMFCAANMPRGYRTVIFEGADAPMRKLLLTGGGRCNYTNLNIDTQKPENFYPRGARNLRKAFRRFGADAVISFFKALKIEPRDEGDGRIFPAVGDAQSIAEGLLKASQIRGAELVCGSRIDSVEKSANGKFILNYAKTGIKKTFEADYVLVAVGGSWSATLKDSLVKMGHSFEAAAPSLFALKIDGAQELKNLSGLSVQDASATVDIGGEKFESRGAILLTHFGVGGPAVLKLSSFGARAFASKSYKFRLFVDWAPTFDTQSRQQIFQKARADFPKREIKNAPLFGLPQKLWEALVARSGIAPKTYSNLSKDDERRICIEVSQCSLDVSGKSTHKAEFVTSGGVNNAEIDFNTMQSRIVGGLFFAGECMDIDAITGGFNLQAAWTCAKICAETLKIFKDLDASK